MEIQNFWKITQQNYSNKNIYKSLNFMIKIIQDFLIEIKYNNFFMIAIDKVVKTLNQMKMIQNYTLIYQMMIKMVKSHLMIILILY